MTNLTDLHDQAIVDCDWPDDAADLLRRHRESLFPSVGLFFDEPIELAERPRAMTPLRLNKVFFTNSGTGANEAAFLFTILGCSRLRRDSQFVRMLACLATLAADEPRSVGGKQTRC